MPVMERKRNADETAKPIWKFQFTRRPFCPDHPTILMVCGTSDKNGRARYYCRVAGCCRSWKGRRIVE